MAANQMKQASNLMLRILSAVILAPLILLIVYIGGIYYQLVLIVAGLLMAMEWQYMTQSISKRGSWLWVGVVYVTLPVFALMMLRQEGGYQVIFWLLAVVWVTDSCAYFVGKTIGGAKLAPSISPNKSWAGFFGGIMGSIVVGLVAALLVNTPDMLLVTSFSATLSIISQLGDLFESKVKRLCDVKDSSNIIPGHGGLLDRLDGLLFAAPFVWLVTTLTGKGPFLWL